MKKENSPFLSGVLHYVKAQSERTHPALYESTARKDAPSIMRKHNLKERTQVTCQAETNVLIRASALFGAVPFDMLWFFVLSQPASGCSAMIFLVTKRRRQSRLMTLLERQRAIRSCFYPPTHTSRPEWESEISLCLSDCIQLSAGSADIPLCVQADRPPVPSGQSLRSYKKSLRYIFSSH